MNDTQKKILLTVARDTIDAVINNKPINTPQTDDPQLNEHCGCFVTLKNDKMLRGCIGQFTADKPLIQMIAQMAVASATEDSRFFYDPITPDEIQHLNIEISVLSPLKKTKDPLSLRLGKDGIYIRKGTHSGCFLPQVATDTGWTKQQFLSNCCSHKANLPPDAWKLPDTKVFLFTADIFNADYNDI